MLLAASELATVLTAAPSQDYLIGWVPPIDSPEERMQRRPASNHLLSFLPPPRPSEAGEWPAPLGATPAVLEQLHTIFLPSRRCGAAKGYAEVRVNLCRACLYAEKSTCNSILKGRKVAVWCSVSPEGPPGPPSYRTPPPKM